MERTRVSERRNNSRVSVPGMKVQICMDEQKGNYDPIAREVKNISYKGIAFYTLKHDYVSEGKHYNFIIEVSTGSGSGPKKGENSSRYSIGGVGHVKYIRSGVAGMAFSFIDTSQLENLSNVLDPTYLAGTLSLVTDSKKSGVRHIRYETDSAGAYIEYKSDGKKEALNISFLDKKIEWSSSSGLAIKVYDEFTKDHVKLTSENSVYLHILSQVSVFVSSVKLDSQIKSILKKILA